MEPKFIDRHLWVTWDQPPPVADFRTPFGDLLADVRSRLAVQDPGPDGWLHLFVRAPLLVTAALDYQLSAGGGPAAAVFRWTIGALRCVFLGESGPAQCAFDTQPRAAAPLLRHEIVSRGDRYSWRASCPALVRQLAGRVRTRCRPDLVLAASHGSMRSGTLLSLYLGSRLYFLRLSRFKRKDLRPMLSGADRQQLEREAKRTREVLVFDEDCMSGRSLELLSNEVLRYFGNVKTASVLRAAQCNPRPDFCVKLVE
jgi:hypothetical protein